MRHASTMRPLHRREFLGLGAGAGLALATARSRARSRRAEPASLILTGGRIATLDPARPFVEALAVTDGRVLATGTAQEVMQRRGREHAGDRARAAARRSRASTTRTST